MFRTNNKYKQLCKRPCHDLEVMAYIPPVPYATDIKILDVMTAISCRVENMIESIQIANGIANKEINPTIICSRLSSLLYFLINK